MPILDSQSSYRINQPIHNTANQRYSLTDRADYYSRSVLREHIACFLTLHIDDMLTQTKALQTLSPTFTRLPLVEIMPHHAAFHWLLYQWSAFNHIVFSISSLPVLFIKLMKHTDLKTPKEAYIFTEIYYMSLISKLTE